MFIWLTRCLPGLSLLALASLLLFAFSDVLRLPPWNDIIPGPGGGSKNETVKVLNIAQAVFVIYTVFIHVNMFVFTLRLAFSLFSMAKRTRRTITKHRSKVPVTASAKGRTESETRGLALSGFQEQSDQLATELTDDGHHSIENRDLIHAIILPNYCEDLDTLRTTLTVLASHPNAKWQYEVS